MLDLNVIKKNKFDIYEKWQKIVSICKNKNHEIHDNGEINLASEWYNFKDFYIWSINNGYDKDIKPVIKRKDITLDYSPDNCYWIDKERLLKTLTNPIDGKTQTWTQWAKELGISLSCLRHRVDGNLSPEKLFTAGPIFKEQKVKTTKPYKVSKFQQVYCNFMQSCYNPKSHNYKNYGARGISVCDDWRNNRDKFEEWALENGYKEGLLLGRIDTDGDYEPDNCVWTTRKDILANKRTCVLLFDDNMILNQASFARKLNITPNALITRLQHNVPKEHLFHKGSLRKKPGLVDFKSVCQ